MALMTDHPEVEMRERVLLVAERLFRQLGYQKTTVADIAKAMRMSPANVYRFFDSKKAIHEGVACRLMGEVEAAARSIASSDVPAPQRLRELLTTVHRMNAERYVGDANLHEMVMVAMEESWDVCVAHMELHHRHDRRGDCRRRRRRRIRRAGRAAGVDLHVHRDDQLLSPAADRPCHDKPGPTLDQMIDFVLAALAPRKHCCRSLPWMIA